MRAGQPRRTPPSPRPTDAPRATPARGRGAAMSRRPRRAEDSCREASLAQLELPNDLLVLELGCKLERLHQVDAGPDAHRERALAKRPGSFAALCEAAAER